MKPNKIIFIYILTFFIFLLSFSLTNATIRYVSKTGSSTPPYTTWETAADSIMKCIDICVFGDTIYVANGVYKEQVVMIPGLSLIGAGTDSCIVDTRSFPPQGLHTIEIADSCLVKGFYIRSSNDFDYGYGIYTIGQTGLVTGNKFSDANIGLVLYETEITAFKNFLFNLRGGIALVNSNSSVRKNEIFTLTENIGSGIYISAFDYSYRPTIDSNYIETKSKGIDKSFGARPIIINNTIVLRNANTGIKLSLADTVDVFNNIIYSENGVEAIYNSGARYLQLFNNYATGNFPFTVAHVIFVGPDNNVKNNVVTDAKRGVRAWGAENFVFQYNNVWNTEVNYSGFSPDSTNLSVDPMIVNEDTTQGELDFHLQMFSPLIDAGDPSILDKDSTRSDIGLYGGPYGESYIYLDLPPRAPRNLTAEVDSVIKLSWNRNTEADFNHYNLYRDTVANFTIDSIKLVVSIDDTFYLHLIPADVESLYFKITAVDNQGNESSPSEEVSVILVSVEEEWQAVNNYLLYQNYPNPFNPSTKIGYKLKERGYVKLYVYDVKGELVSVLVNKVQEAGYYEVQFNASGSSGHSGLSGINELASGVYIYQIMVRSERDVPVFNDIKKMIYLK